MTKIPEKTLTIEQNRHLLTRHFGAEFAKQMMALERRLGIKRPLVPAVIEF